MIGLILAIGTFLSLLDRVLPERLVLVRGVEISPHWTVRWRLSILVSEASCLKSAIETAHWAFLNLRGVGRVENCSPFVLGEGVNMQIVEFFCHVPDPSKDHQEVFVNI